MHEEQGQLARQLVFQKHMASSPFRLSARTLTERRKSSLETSYHRDSPQLSKEMAGFHDKTLPGVPKEEKQRSKESDSRNRATSGLDAEVNKHSLLNNRVSRRRVLAQGRILQRADAIERKRDK